ncbi:hypothetical protein MRB53_022255 [Persea americana]|uniref:Uncharacterized protein n=1 Tax=Persea americana TaxID=3435 RepID=A0ACC2L639_PERAE|nr:hypothetical protein MRB53_022255 [Persea americana]
MSAHWLVIGPRQTFGILLFAHSRFPSTSQATVQRRLEYDPEKVWPAVNVRAYGEPLSLLDSHGPARHVPDRNWPTGPSGETAKPSLDTDRKWQTGNRVMGCVWWQIAITGI